MTENDFLTELYVAVQNHARRQVQKDHANHWEIRNEDEKVDRKMEQMIWYMAEHSAREPDLMEQAQ